MIINAYIIQNVINNDIIRKSYLQKKNEKHIKEKCHKYNDVTESYIATVHNKNITLLQLRCYL